MEDVKRLGKQILEKFSWKKLGEQKLDELEPYRNLSSYQELKRYFADSGNNYSETGLGSDDLNLGNLVDISHLYLKSAEGSTGHAQQVLRRIVQSQIAEPMQSSAMEFIETTFSKEGRKRPRYL